MNGGDFTREERIVMKGRRNERKNRGEWKRNKEETQRRRK